MYTKRSTNEQFDIKIEKETANNSWKAVTNGELDVNNNNHLFTTTMIEKREPIMTYNRSETSSWNSYIPTQELLVSLLNCYCGKPAKRTLTEEHGPILECANYNNYDLNFTCAFHVHETSWKGLIDQLKNDKNVGLEHPDLRECHYYNFTFCSTFHVTNSFKLVPPDNLPTCYCRKPVMMKITRNGFQFICRNEEKKCHWSLSAKDLILPKTRFRIHTVINEKALNENKHKSNLLATLISCTPSPQLPDYSPTRSFNEQQSSSLNHDELQQYEEQTIQRLQQHNTELQESIQHKQTEYEEIANQIRIKMDNLQMELYRLNQESIDQEAEELSCQERLVQVEIEIESLIQENQKLVETLNDIKRENLNLSLLHEEEPNKCTVCFTRNIEYCLQPCFHYCYCQLCASKLSNCAICRQPVKSIQQIFQYN